MGHKHTREQILEGALAAAIEDGLSRLTFGRVAKRLGVNDRIVVYYFPTKDALITEVLMSMAADLQTVVAAAFAEPADDHLDLVRSAWPVLTKPGIDSTFSLFFEATGLAAAGREPYRTVSAQLIEAWIDWLTGFLSGPAKQRRIEAEAAIALVDGLLLMRQVVGPEAANRAAVRLGVG